MCGDHDLNNDTWLWSIVAGVGARYGGDTDYVYREGFWDFGDPNARFFSGSYYAPPSGLGSLHSPARARVRRRATSAPHAI